MNDLSFAQILSFLAMFVAPILHGGATFLLWNAHRRSGRLVPALAERLLASRTWTIVAVIVAMTTINGLTGFPFPLDTEQRRWLITLALWLSTFPSIRFLRMYFRHEFKNGQGVERLRRELAERRAADTTDLNTRRSDDRAELAQRRAED